MKSLRYLNTVLTAVAILLGLQLWTSWNSPAANDAGSALVSPAHAAGLPDAGAQRKDMINELKSLRKQMADTHSLLASGKVRVQVQDPVKDED